MTSSAQRSNSRGKRAVFSFGDEDEDDETLRSNLQPLTKTAVDRSAFTSPHFDPDQFLSSRRHLGLERLKVELNNHLRYLKTELFELINRDYQDFINLSTNLKGVDRTIDDLRRPLLKMGTKAEVSSGYLIALIAYEMLIIFYSKPETISRQPSTISRVSCDTEQRYARRRYEISRTML